ncbi:unnamed protein product [Calypogeia fissa]
MAASKGLDYIGCVAIDALEEVGAGVEGWIDNPSVVFAMSREQIAFARERVLVMQLRWKGASEAVLTQVGASSSEFHEVVTSLEWLAFDEFTVLAVGTSLGALMLYSQWGIPLFRQYFNAGPVLRIRARQDCNLTVGTTVSEDVCLVFPKAIVRIDVLDIYALLRRFVPRRERGSRDGSSSGRRYGDLQRTESVNFTLAYEMWNISKSAASGACADGVLACVMAPPLLEHQLKRHYCALTVGADYTLAAFRVSGEKRSSLAGVVFDKVMPAAVSTITSLAKRFWKSDPTSESNRPTEVTPQAFGRATLITTLLDNRRKGVSLAVSPSGSLAAVTDSLGRISLVDVQALVVVRLWKGYRDAHCMFLEAPRDGRQGYEEGQSRRRSTPDRDDFSLCLAIHAPRRGYIEVWQMRYGARLMVVRCTESCRLVQPSCKFKFSNEPMTFESVDRDEFTPTKVYIFYANSGILSVLNPFSPT